MQKIFFLILLFSTSFLLANDSLDDFIDGQIKVEAKFFDQNISLDEKVLIKKQQETAYDKFFFQYAANSEKNLQEKNPYRTEINRVKLSLSSNKYQGYTNAVMRDEVLLKSYDIRNSIRKILHETLEAAKGNSKKMFKEKVNNILSDHLSKFQLLDEKKYVLSDQNHSSPIVKSLLLAIKNQVYLESVVNTFSSELVENSTNIYITSRISGSRLLSMLNTINTTPYGLKINSYLSPFNLNVAKAILILAIIFFIFIVNRMLGSIINRTLLHFKIKKDDIDYINSHITNLFNMITSLLIIHLVILAFWGVDNESINISKLFGILYVVLIALLLYRISNTVAYMRTEHIKNSKILKNEVINLAIKVNNGVIILIAVIAILRIFEVDLTALLSGLGIAGAAVAFAAKDSIANIFGSISILAGDVFEQGDWIETKDVNGTVVEIGLRASTIRTFDNALISIPNSELANNGIKNWSRRRIGRRIKMNIGVTYQSDFDDIRHAIADIREMLKEHPGIANQRTEYHDTYRESKLVSTEDYKGIKRTTLVFMDEFADSSINILIYCFSRSVVWDEWLEVKEDVMFKIAEILKKNNIDFAYPSLTVHQADKENLNAPEIKVL